MKLIKILLILFIASLCSTSGAVENVKITGVNLGCGKYEKGTETLCADSCDNDRDGDVDGADSDCSATWNPLTDANLLGAYFMNGTGDETDRSGNGNTFTEMGTVTSIDTFVSGFSGKARSVATVSDYLYQANGGGLDIYGADQQFEFGGWFKIDTDNNADQVLYSNYAATGNNRQWRVFLSDSTDTISAALSSDGTSSTVTIARSATGMRALFSGANGAHLSVKYDDSNIAIYINGSVSTSADNPKDYSSGTTDKTSTSRVGLSGDDSGGGNCSFDELYLYSRVLLDAERTQIITNGLSGDKGGSD
jgi:hypothetical protein